MEEFEQEIFVKMINSFISPSKRRILRILDSFGEMRQMDIASHLNISQTSLIYHLKDTTERRNRWQSIGLEAIGIINVKKSRSASIKKISLTENGRKLIQKYDLLKEEVQENVING